MEPPRTIPVGEWLPDLPHYSNPGALVAKNVVPDVHSYRPFKDFAAQSDALTGECLGGTACKDADNNVFVYAGDSSKLYEMVDNSFTDESKVGGYTTATDDAWEFACWGANNKVIATNFTDPVQSIAAGGGAAGAFADMITSTNKPKAKHVAIVRDFAVLANTSDATDGHKPSRLWWSAIRDETDFDPAASTQCDYADLPEGGWINRVVGGAEYGVVFQDSMIRRMDYAGAPLVFDIPAVDRGRGAPIPGGVVALGRSTFFISHEGFFAFDGAQSHSIGSGKVDRTFWQQFDLNNKKGVSAAIDPVNKLVCWAFPGDGAATATPNKIYMYRWDTGKWSEAEIDTQFVMSAMAQGYTLEGLDAVSADIDALAVSLDSEAWKGGKLNLSLFNTSNILGTLDGSALAATVETGEIELTAGGRTEITGIRMLVDDAAHNVQVAGKQQASDTLSYTAASSPNSFTGECNVSVDARYHRIRCNIDAGADWTHLQGVQPRTSQKGLW